MCHVAKLYESVLEARLRRATEDKLGPWQHGFREGVGTCDMIFDNRLKNIGNLINLCTSHF